MPRLKTKFELAMAVKASNEHEGKVDSKVFRERAVRSSGIPPTAESNGGGPPEARGITRRSKLLETSTSTITMADEGPMGDESVAPSMAEGGVFRRPKKLSQAAVAITTKLPGSREKSMKHDRMLSTDRGESMVASKPLATASDDLKLAPKSVTPRFSLFVEKAMARGMGTKMGMHKSVDEYQKLKEAVAARKIQRMVKNRGDVKKPPTDFVVEQHGEGCCRHQGPDCMEARGKERPERRRPHI